MRRGHYESDDATFPHEAYRVRQYQGIAFHVLGWETEPDEDTEWSGQWARTGNALAVMVGDDRRHSVDPDDLAPLDDLAYCASCGQIGCAHDGRVRDDE